MAQSARNRRLALWGGLTMLGRLRRGLFWLSRSAPMGAVVRLAFGRLWWLLPVRRVAQTPGVLAFEHPAPSWEPHILLVPKRSMRSLAAARPSEAPLFGEILRLGLSLARRSGLDRDGFALLVNGGSYQDVPQLHVHLAGLDDDLRYGVPTGWLEQVRSGMVGLPYATSSADARGPGLLAFRSPDPARETHLVIVLSEPLAWGDLAGPRGQEVGRALLLFAQPLVNSLDLGETGFTLLASVPPGGLDDGAVFHLVGGGRAR